MKIHNEYHLTYCTNIHPAETWPEVFINLNKYLPEIKRKLCPNQPFGLGLYLSNSASIEVLQGSNLYDFKNWLKNNDLYVFTMNGFPYGGFHNKVVKDQVYKPDWTASARVDYTKRLFSILAELLPDDMEGGVSTSPVSYKFWHRGEDAVKQVFLKATENLIEVVAYLHQLHVETGKALHLDIEPEPDCLLENSDELISFFNDFLIPKGTLLLTNKGCCNYQEAEDIIRRHVRVCYDICHFAVEFEEPATVLSKFKSNKIAVGKIQISAALKAEFNEQTRQEAVQEFHKFVEPTYLHQTVERDENNHITRYRDLDQALQDKNHLPVELRTHFHVPIFINGYGLLNSTQDDIKKIINLARESKVTSHLEVETYTWEILPEDLRIDIGSSIFRELNWVIEEFKR